MGPVRPIALTAVAPGQLALQMSLASCPKSVGFPPSRPVSNRTVELREVDRGRVAMASTTSSAPTPQIRIMARVPAGGLGGCLRGLLG